MASVNKAIIIGNLGRDPEIRMTATGKKVATFSIATSEKFTDNQGQAQERTEWHNIVLWGKLADICERYVKKGTPIYLEGKISTRSWDDQQTGQKRYKTEIVGHSMQMLGSSGQQQSGGYQYHQQMPPVSNQPIGGQDISEEDLPF